MDLPADLQIASGWMRYGVLAWQSHRRELEKGGDRDSRAPYTPAEGAAE